jgi:hypothetical protein
MVDYHINQSKKNVNNAAPSSVAKVIFQCTNPRCANCPHSFQDRDASFHQCFASFADVGWLISFSDHIKDLVLFDGRFTSGVVNRILSLLLFLFLLFLIFCHSDRPHTPE